MGQTLDIFKQAGLGDFFSRPEVQNYIKPALYGAGAGALGMGASSLLGGPQEEETGGDMTMRVLKNMAMGGGLGAAAGVGGRAVYDQFANPAQHPALKLNKVQQLAEQMKAKGQTPDLNPYGKTHYLMGPTREIVDTPGLGMGLGGVVGMKLKSMRDALQRTKLDEIFTGANEQIAKSETLKPGQIRVHDPASHFSAMSAAVANRTNGMSAADRLAAMKKLISQQSGITNIGLEPLASRFGFHGSDASSAAKAVRSAQEDGRFATAHGARGFVGKTLQALRNAPANVANTVMDSPRTALQNVGSYARHGAAGAVVGGLGQEGVKMLVDRAVRSHGSPEQLQIWKELADEARRQATSR